MSREITKTRIKEVIRCLVKTPELSMYNLEHEIEEYSENLINDYQMEKSLGGEGPLTLYFGDTNIQTNIPFRIMSNFIDSSNISMSNYWTHNGIDYDSKVVLPLWSLTPRVISEVGVWEFYNGQTKIAKVVQNPSFEDEIYSMFILSKPEDWIERFNSMDDLTGSISPLTGYVIFETEEIELIEAVLLNLSFVGLHAFKPKYSTWMHSLENGCTYIEDTGQTIIIDLPNDFSIERSRMFRFASVGEDPFDAILRYWHIIEHMFDNLVEFIITEIITRPGRPKKFSRNVSKNITEAACAESIFVNRISLICYNEIERFIDTHQLKPSIEMAAVAVGSTNYKFWDKDGENRLKAIGSLIYSFRNAVTHRRETEHWFDRLLPEHENSAKQVIPLIQFLVFYAIWDK